MAPVKLIKKRLAAVSLVLVLVVGLGACGDSEPPTTTPGGPSTTEPVGS